MQLILNLLNKDFNFSDSQLHDALSRSSGGLFNSQHGLGGIIQRFAKGEFSKDALIGQALVATKTTVKINDLTHLHNLAQAFKNGDAARKINQRSEKYAICLALICHQQAKGDPRAFNFTYIDELLALYDADKVMAPAIKARKMELMNAIPSIRRSVSIQQASKKKEEQKDSPLAHAASSSSSTKEEEQPLKKEELHDAALDVAVATTATVKPALTSPPSLKRAEHGEASQKRALTLDVNDDTPNVLLPLPNQSGILSSAPATPPLQPIPIDVSSPKKMLQSSGSDSYAQQSRPLSPLSLAGTPTPPRKDSASSSEEHKLSPRNQTLAVSPKAIKSPSQTKEPALSVAPSPSSRASKSSTTSAPLKPLKSLSHTEEHALNTVPSPSSHASRSALNTSMATSSMTHLDKEGKAVVSPDLVAIQASLEKARWWKTALALAVSVLTCFTVVIPVVCYVLWKRAKENEAVQKVERTAADYSTVQIYRQGLNSPKVENEPTVKSEQVVAPTNENEKTAYFLYKGQAKQFRFYEDRMKQKQNASLNDQERARLVKEKEEDIQLVQSLRI